MGYTFLLEFHFYRSLLLFLVCAYCHIGPCFSVNSDKWLKGFRQILELPNINPTV